MSRTCLPTFLISGLAGLLSAPILASPQASTARPASEQKYPTGYDDTPFLPGGKWRVHDGNRPRPEIITPGTESTPDVPGRPPSDAIVLFDGKDLSKWQARSRDGEREQIVASAWKVENGYFEVVPRTGGIFTKEEFGDIQLHIEWAAPQKIEGASQGRGNSGVLIMGRYEVQVLDSFDNVSYADGQAGAIYGQYPPLVNASRKPGEWQTYDIVFEAPRFEDDKLIKPAYATVLHNGVLLHHRRELLGPMQHQRLTEYELHGPEGPLMLQQHSNPVRYRNVWIRRLNLSE
ncbi:MAG: DUF1080 domain-containing protein [Bryobacterales bacterium]